MKGGKGSRRGPPAAPTSWDAVAGWYDGWMGAAGSDHHQVVAVPALLALSAPQPGERIVDIGCGQGVLAGPLTAAGAHYTGVDASPRLLAAARRHGHPGRFLLGDARQLLALPDLQPARWDAAVFLLSLQDMDPLLAVVEQAAALLRSGGRLVAVLTHPAFRVPRQSGWGWDAARKLQYRRVDRYLTPLPVPMKRLTPDAPATRSFHRPVSAYVNALAAAGLLVEQMSEIPGHKAPAAPDAGAADRARREIPLFLGLRARKVEG